MCSALGQDVAVALELVLGLDRTPMDRVKGGETGGRATPAERTHVVVAGRGHDDATVSSSGGQPTVRAPTWCCGGRSTSPRGGDGGLAARGVGRRTPVVGTAADAPAPRCWPPRPGASAGWRTGRSRTSAACGSPTAPGPTTCSWPRARLVLHDVRPGLAHRGADAAAGGPHDRRGHAPRPRGPAGCRVDEETAEQPRSCTRYAARTCGSTSRAGSTSRPSTTARSTPRRCG